ncbi:MAG: hypothetical protein OXE02_14980 [Chloroflexi bacterium]|nr:hypothetical protein [Chloroflexota bacterium]
MTEHAMDDLHAEVVKGVEALQCDDYVEYTDETLPQLVEDIARRGRERSFPSFPPTSSFPRKRESRSG